MASTDKPDDRLLDPDTSRRLIVAFEEQLSTAKRGHRLRLWIGRTLFIVTLGAASMAATILAIAKRVRETIARDGADVVHARLILTGAQRQINMLESNVFALLNTKDISRADGREQLLTVQRRIDTVVDTAIKQLGTFADPQREARVIQFRRPRAA